MKFYPFAPQCDCWVPTRCPNKAAYALVAPDGTLNPGGPLCTRDAVAVIKAYQQELGERWTLRAIRVLPGNYAVLEAGQYLACSTTTKKVSR